MDLKGLAIEYERRKPFFQRLEEEAKFILQLRLNDTDIKIHSLTSRVKQTDSFMQKVISKGVSNPFKEITDSVGLRVVCLFLGDIERIGQIVRQEFDVFSEDNKIDGSDLSSFGYMSFHFVVRIREACIGPRYEAIKAIPFEIQIRTIAMESWATVSHYLSYKSEIDVPKELQRDFYALSGLFYVADAHFETLYRAREKGLERLSQTLDKPEGVSQRLDLDSLTTFLHKRFPEREHCDDRHVSQLLGELKELGHSTIAELEETIGRAWQAFLLYEKKYPPENEVGDKVPFADVGVIRVVLELTNPKHRGHLIGSKKDRAKYLRLVKPSRDQLEESNR